MKQKLATYLIMFKKKKKKIINTYWPGQEYVAVQ